MFDDFLKKSAELVAAGESFATATVVRCQAPTSGKPGDKAIVLPDGRLWGWIGGGCAQPVVIKEALKCLADGRPRLVRITPSTKEEEEGVVDYTMTCHSGGALDIYIEPVLPKPHIVILGRSPIAQALARLGRVIGYSVSVVAEEFSAGDFGDAALSARKNFSLDGIGPSTPSYVVVSTQGEGDEEALEEALASNASYVAFVASKTKTQKVIEYLRQRGVAGERLKQVRAPAGLNIGAVSPQEIAVSVLAEIIQVRGASELQHLAQPKSAPQRAVTRETRDPICGMTVDPAKAKYKSEYQDKSFYFCCAGCKQTFDKAPEKYAVPHA
ncbi:MAG TPA: XdhC family protein [Candidatus Angelobacter sp.]|nr:XdhC family protein [Candidatus Angelobacter sp.]